MPLEKLWQENKAIIGLWKIQETEQALYQNLKDPFADSILEKISHSTVRRRFLAGRMVVKKLCKEASIPFEGVDRNSAGKPNLVNTTLECSISHTKGFATAILSNIAVGIDIEFERAQIRGITDKFLNTKEKIWAGNSIERLTKLWIAKEAAYKWASEKDTFLKENFSVITNTYQQEPTSVSFQKGLELSKESYLHFKKYESLHLAYCI